MSDAALHLLAVSLGFLLPALAALLAGSTELALALAAYSSPFIAAYVIGGALALLKGGSSWPRSRKQPARRRP